MKNPILAQLNPKPAQNNNDPMAMIRQFNEFKQQMRGRDPQQMVNQLLQSGKMTPQQFEQLKQQANALQMFLK
jgi:hypothetical protein